MIGQSIPEADQLMSIMGDKAKLLQVNNSRRATMIIDHNSLLKASEYLFKDLNFRFIIASAFDSGKNIEIYYHFSLDVKGLILNLRVMLERNNPEIESLTGLFDAANWIEREMRELFGIKFLNHPDPEKLISDGNWAEGVYPYRKN